MKDDKPEHEIDWVALHAVDRMRGVETASGCLEWQGVKIANGYGRRALGGRMILVHRIACLAHHGPAPAGAPDALHSCDNRACFNPLHLRWGTPSENMRERSMRSARHAGLKLTPEQVTAIRRALAGGETGASIGRRYGVSHGTVSYIKHGKTWSHHHEH